jgi:hypothetical protein
MAKPRLVEKKLVETKRSQAASRLPRSRGTTQCAAIFNENDLNEVLFFNVTTLERIAFRCQ